MIVGPVSASHSSTLAGETALTTDNPDAIIAGHVFLDNATEIWHIDRVVPWPAPAPASTTTFFPPSIRRMFLRHLSDYAPVESASNPLRRKTPAMSCVHPSRSATTDQYWYGVKLASGHRPVYLVSPTPRCAFLLRPTGPSLGSRTHCPAVSSTGIRSLPGRL